MNMLVGLDDTDAPSGMCTTYLATIIMRALNVDSTPKLIRLNPNIPYKTRGNGAVSFKTGESKENKNEVIKYVKANSKLSDPNTNPGIAFVPELTESKRRVLKQFYKKTLSELVSIEDAENTASEVGATLLKFKNGRGVVGALAACGAQLEDKTYELITYRVRSNYGRKRMIDAESVFRMNRLLYPTCFDNVDLESNRVLITPRGRDPVFCGIRGETPEAVFKAWSMVNPLEEIEHIQIFESNQATDVHLVQKKISDVRQYDCVILNGSVSKKPYPIPGGHVLFGLQDGTGEITCCAYRQSGRLRGVVSSLICGDEVTVYGGVGKYENTVNLERIAIEKLAVNASSMNPSCHGRRMTSLGKDKGFRCRVCRKRIIGDERISVVTPRKVSCGLYEPPPSSRRHLSKPLVRFNLK
jgi:tRNA(Ile2)-agmatinylcytidine synthase